MMEGNVVRVIYHPVINVLIGKPNKYPDERPTSDIGILNKFVYNVIEGLTDNATHGSVVPSAQVELRKTLLQNLTPTRTPSHASA